MNKIAVLVAATIVVLSLASQQAYASLDPGDPLLQEAMDLLSRIQELDRMEVNVSSLVHELNASIALLQEGRRAEAQKLLDDLNERVNQYESTAAGHYLRVRLYRFLTVGILLSIPVLFYLLFPRIYLYLWFRWRRRWIISESSR